MPDPLARPPIDAAVDPPPHEPVEQAGARADADERLVRVAVLGSCISRDAFNSRFNPDYKRAYECVLMQNQSSLISLMSPGFALTEEQLGPRSAYDRWNVTTDLSKEFLDRVAELAPDYLVLDFFGDVHFGCLDLGDGRYITNNRWKLWPTPYYRELQASGPPRWLRLDVDTEEYLRLWRSAYDRLVEHLRRVAPGTTVVVHRGRNTDALLLPDADAPVSLSRSGRVKRVDVPLLNRLWAELDDYAVSSTGFDQVDLTGREYPTSPDHPWGAFYVHYAMGYYADFLAALTTVHLRRVLARPEHAPGAVLLDQLVDHHRRPADEAAQQADVVIRRLRARVRRQEERLRAQAQRLAEPQLQPRGGPRPGPGGPAPRRSRVRSVGGAVRRAVRPALASARLDRWVRPARHRLDGP